MPDTTLPESPESTPALSVDATEAGQRCEKCHAYYSGPACQSCGWYAALGVHLDLDSRYEVRLGPEVDSLQEVDETPAESELAKHLRVWSEIVPPWTLVVGATVLGIVALGVFARVATADTPSLRTMVGVSGLVGGMFTLLVAHIVGFVLVASNDAELGLPDLLIKPLRSWASLLVELPKRLWLVNAGAASLTTALVAALIVGGIPYERLLDWGFKAPPKQDLIGAIASRAAQVEGDNDSLEDSVSDFASKAGDLEAADGKPRERVDCLVVGFRQSDRGEIASLLLAAAGSDNELKFVGQVRPLLSDEEQTKLLDQFKRALASKPFVKTSLSAVWLKPRFTCRASYSEWPDGRRPKELRWEEMLGEVKLPR